MTTPTPGADLDAAIRRLSIEARADAAARSDAARAAVGGDAGELHELLVELMLGTIEARQFAIAGPPSVNDQVRADLIRLAADFRDICARDGAAELADVWNEIAIVFAEFDDAQRRRGGVRGTAL